MVNARTELHSTACISVGENLFKRIGLACACHGGLCPAGSK